MWGAAWGGGAGWDIGVRVGWGAVAGLLIGNRGAAMRDWCGVVGLTHKWGSASPPPPPHIGGLLTLPPPQESYVWKMYQERCWDFFPAGDCFRKQYEDQLG